MFEILAKLLLCVFVPLAVYLGFSHFPLWWIAPIGLFGAFVFGFWSPRGIEAQSDDEETPARGGFVAATLLTNFALTAGLFGLGRLAATALF